MEQLDAALDAAEASTKIRKAAHDFRILCSTLKIIVWRHHMTKERNTECPHVVGGEGTC